MELLKTEYSENKGIGKLDKVMLKCEESNYYKLTEFLYTSQNEQALVLKALYECDINVVLKFGQLESIEKEYNLGCIENYNWNENNFDILKNVLYLCTF